MIFLKLEFFPEENPTQKLTNSLGPRRNCQKKSKCVHRFAFLTRNSQSFETEYKITVVDKTLVSEMKELVFSKKITIKETTWY